MFLCPLEVTGSLAAAAGGSEWELLAQGRGGSRAWAGRFPGQGPADHGWLHTDAATAQVLWFK